MILNVYSVYDSKVGAYLQPMFFRQSGEALRAFESASRNPEHGFSKHAEDYTLFHLGSFNDEDAHFEVLKTPVSLGKAIEFIG